MGPEPIIFIIGYGPRTLMLIRKYQSINLGKYVNVDWNLNNKLMFLFVAILIQIK